MTIEVNLSDYLNEADIRDICACEVHAKIREDLRHMNVNTIISNLSYEEVFRMVDEQIGENGYCRKTIAEKVPELVNSLSSYSIFRKADAWERTESIGQKILDEEVAKARPLIADRIKAIIEEYDFPQLQRDEIPFTIADIITDTLFGRKEDSL